MCSPIFSCHRQLCRACDTVQKDSERLRFEYDRQRRVSRKHRVVLLCLIASAKVCKQSECRCIAGRRLSECWRQTTTLTSASSLRDRESSRQDSSARQTPPLYWPCSFRLYGGLGRPCVAMGQKQKRLFLATSGHIYFIEHNKPQRTDI